MPAFVGEEVAQVGVGVPREPAPVADQLQVVPVQPGVYVVADLDDV
jgi:hypothetical protein